MNEKQSFVLYYDIREPLSLLNDSERGRLFSAILNYAEYGELPDFDGAAQMAFAFIRKALDRDAEKWESKREKRVEAGRLGGLKRVENLRQTETDGQANQANATFAKQTKHNQANQAVPAPVPAPVPVPVPALYEVESEAGKPPTRTRFIPPTEEEIAAYCHERQNDVDARRFFDYYTANGWTQGRGKPIRDWRAAVRTWERGDSHAGQDHSGDGRSAANYDIIEGITRL